MKPLEWTNTPRATIAALLALALAGCQLGPRPVSGPQSMPSGEWAIVEVRPGASGVRDPGDAVSRHGQVISYEVDLARSGRDVCHEPRYLASLIVADSYVRRELGVPLSDLGLGRWQDVRVTEVYCQGGKRWRALGGEVVWVEADRGYAVREGTLYVLRRVGDAAPR